MTPTSRSPRYLFLDALRGIAALAVALYHFYVFSGLRAPMSSAFPDFLDVALAGGHVGVAVFFVLSGFVIAHSLDGVIISRDYVMRFAIRRSLRLDPPYWVVLAIASLLLLVTHRPISGAQVAAHVVYLQTILGYPQIVSVFWTLTYEIQFYLVLILGYWIAQRWPRMKVPLFLVPFLASLYFVVTNRFAQGIFIDRWYSFALGAATSLLLSRRLSLRAWSAIVLAGAVAAAIGAPTSTDGAAPTAVLTTCLIAAVGLRGRLASWSGGSVLQYLGRISYSLYLVHFIGSAFAKAGGARHPGVGAAFVWLLGALVISVVIAEVFYRLVERPSQRLSRTLRWAQIRPASAAPPLRGEEVLAVG